MGYMEEYYSNFRNMSIEEYVDTYLRTQRQIDRINQTVDFLPDDITSVLDVGAGFGILLEEIENRRGIKGVGVEITDAKIDYARKRGIDMRKGDAGKLDFPDNSFDLVISCEVIEHLPYGVFESALSEFVRVSRKYIVIAVPFDENRVFVQCPYCGASVDPNYHMRKFDENSMPSLFLNARLEKIAFIDYEVTSSIKNWLARLKRKEWPPFLVCPSCGYRDTNYISGNENVYSSVGRFPMRNALKRLAWTLLTMTGKRKPMEILGLYSVIS